MAALALLASIALWPEIDRDERTRRALAFRRSAGEPRERRRSTDARYHGVDDQRPPLHGDRRDRQQVRPERINLTKPKGDITLENGTWLMVQSKHGVFMQHATSSTCRAT